MEKMAEGDPESQRSCWDVNRLLEENSKSGEFWVREKTRWEETSSR